nr:growth-regulating factor 7 [Ipomoea batatas]
MENGAAGGGVNGFGFPDKETAAGGGAAADSFRMATSLGFPFTCAQWKELERQAMVYKYMMASVPVPPDLLLPLPTDAYNAAPPSFHAQSGGSGGVGFSGKNRDLEPGRCKRTDGKKWRCSKEVALNQKYCERHLHRGRPRSRKPQPANPAPSSSDKHKEAPQCLDSRMDHTFSISPFNEPHRGLDWEMGGTEEQWKQLMSLESNVYRENAQNLQQMSLFHCKDYYGSIRQNGECNLYFNPDLGSLNKEFINAWANGSIANNSNTNTDYALSLAMAAGNILDSEMGVEDGNAGGNCDEEHTMCNGNLTLRSPVSWVPFASGGPLAEVLKPSQQLHHPSSSSYISNGDSISPAGTTVSSPSGVLQKTNLFSQSDGSVCNSPTVAASELVPFQWLS